MDERQLTAEEFKHATKSVAQVLSGNNLDVIFCGTSAYCEYDDKYHARRMVLPQITDANSETLRKVSRGYVDHETAHLIFSDMDAEMKVLKKYDENKVKMLHVLVNILEDARIERAMGDKYEGCKSNICALFKEIFNAEWVADTSASSGVDFVLSTLLIGGRAILGNPEAQALLDANPVFFEPYHKFCKDFPFEKELPKCRNNGDIAKLAIKIYEFFKEDLKKQEEQANAEDGSESESEEIEVGIAVDGNSAEGKEGSAKSANKPKENKDKEQEDKSEDDSDGKGQDNKEKKEDEEKRDGKNKTPGNPDKNKDKSEDKDESENGDDKQKGSEQKKKEDERKNKENEEKAEQKISNALDSLESFETRAKAILEKLSEEEISNATDGFYAPLCTDYDKVLRPTLEDCTDEKALPWFESKIESGHQVLKKTIERYLSAHSVATWAHGLKSGKLNGSGLHKLKFGDERVFKKRIESKTNDVAISLLIDCSGSMMWGKIDLACISAWLFSRALTAVGINHEILGFTSLNNVELHRNGCELASKNVLAPNSIVRTEYLLMPLFKEFGKPANSGLKTILANTALGSLKGLRMGDNIDHESIAFAGKRLMTQPQKRKMMFVFTDGYPQYNNIATMSPTRVMSTSIKLAKQVVENLEKSGCEIFGIGIESAHCNRIYNKYAELSSATELPTLLMNLLRQNLV